MYFEQGLSATYGVELMEDNVSYVKKDWESILHKRYWIS